MNKTAALPLLASAAFFACSATAHATTYTPHTFVARHLSSKSHHPVTRPVHPISTPRLRIITACAARANGSPTAGPHGVVAIDLCFPRIVIAERRLGVVSV